VVGEASYEGSVVAHWLCLFRYDVAYERVYEVFSKLYIIKHLSYRKCLTTLVFCIDCNVKFVWGILYCLYSRLMVSIESSFLLLTSFFVAVGRNTKYCDHRVCMSVDVGLWVCLHVFRSHISKNQSPNFNKFSVHVTCLWPWPGPHYVDRALSTSGIVDDVKVSHNGLRVCSVANYSPWLARWRR